MQRTESVDQRGALTLDSTPALSVEVGAVLSDADDAVKVLRGDGRALPLRRHLRARHL